MKTLEQIKQEMIQECIDNISMAEMYIRHNVAIEFNEKRIEEQRTRLVIINGHS